MMRNFKGQVARDMGIGNGLNSHLAKGVRGVVYQVNHDPCILPPAPLSLCYERSNIVKIFIYSNGNK